MSQNQLPESTPAGTHPLLKSHVKLSGGLQRVCNDCRQKLPVERFPCLPDPRCDVCIPPDVRELKEAKSMEAARRQLAALIDCGDLQTDVQAPRLNSILAAIMRQWGGAEGFAVSLHMDIEACKPGSSAKLTAKAGILKLLAMGERLEQRIDEAALSREQLEAQKQMGFVDALVELARNDKTKFAFGRVLRNVGLDVTPENLSQIITDPTIDPVALSEDLKAAEAATQ